ncbi:MAG: histidine--tRNA ligase [Armatimonadetes bacterium]|nr:histidine--tRNA ligase [Armatimonadota bacterium]MBS1700629.1 histidine--tRNA ligase [Armatimonadota bacterium]
MRIQAPRGTEDVLPGQAVTWQWLESIYRELAHHFGYGEIRTPVFEDVALFKRTAGEQSDIVSKEMYEFQDKGGRDVALKPEGTAPVMRAVVEHNLCPQGTHARFYYLTPCYRYNRSQKGRLRELHQFGAELLGANSAEADAEILELAYRFLCAIGLGNEPIYINSIGRTECRSKFSEHILEFVDGYLKDASTEVSERIRKNPLGMLDSKDPDQQKALEGLRPILEFLEPDSRERFEALKQLLDEAEVPYEVSPGTVRGLDYYTETVFEFVSQYLPGLSIFGGGRYDNLVKEIGGPQTPCVGFGIGVERVILAVQEKQVQVPINKPDIFVVRATNEASSMVRELTRNLRSNGKTVLLDLDSRSMKSQMRQADSSQSRFCAIIGDSELAKRTVSLKNMETGEQTEVPVENVLGLL